MLFRLGSAHVDINPWNPLYAVAPFFILFVSIPLAIFAIVTTIIAVTALTCRGLVVYIHLGTALLIAWMASPSKSHFSHRPPKASSPENQSSQHNRTRRSSTISTTSSQDTAVAAPSLAPKSGSFTTLTYHNDMARDYEGVGGWRDTGDDNEEALWMSINGRLELPAGPPLRRHQRSLTGGAVPTRRTKSPEAMRASLTQSRTRILMVPTADERHGNEDYFPPPSLARIHSTSNIPDPSRRHQRRVSGSASSTSSSLMTVVKESGE